MKILLKTVGTVDVGDGGAVVIAGGSVMLSGVVVVTAVVPTAVGASVTAVVPVVA
jgi:hypothetical protein